MPGWVEAGYAEYARRLPHEARLILHEVPAGKRGKNADLARLLREEGERLLAAAPRGAHLIALERTGRVIDTAALAARLQDWQQQGVTPAILIGGPEGLDPACLAAAREQWSLSALTLPHPLVRVLLAEQLYRAWSIMAGHPYHR